MTFSLPTYVSPDFVELGLANPAPAQFLSAPADGVAPPNFHGTSNHPEYVFLEEHGWRLVRESRMDAVIRMRGQNLEVLEPRKLQRGDRVAVGRTEDGQDGIYVHTSGFRSTELHGGDKFAFRTRGTRETPFSRSYDHLYELLRYERTHGYVVWVLGPAIAFDRDSRNAMAALIRGGFCHALLAGNALATHDLEAGAFGTGLGQDIYSQSLLPMGHYNHLDVLNTVRLAGSIPAAFQRLGVNDGIIHACTTSAVPYVLCGSIRDDGPLPEVIADVYDGQDAMRLHARRATTVISLATQLHAIATGNMTPSYNVADDGVVRPTYLYVVDMSEFSVDKLANRGSAQAVGILTNAQDFMINLSNNLISM